MVEGTNTANDSVKFVNGLYRNRESLDSLVELHEEADYYTGFFKEVMSKKVEEGRAEGRAEALQQIAKVKLSAGASLVDIEKSLQALGFSAEEIKEALSTLMD